MNKRYKTFRRVIITGPMDERLEAIDWCYDNGYDMRYTGPRPLGPERIDTTRFEIVAEKRVK